MNSGYGEWSSSMVNPLSAMIKSLGSTRHKKPDSLVICLSEACPPHASDKKKLMDTFGVMPTGNSIVLCSYNLSLWWSVGLNHEDALWRFRYNLSYIGGVGCLTGLLEDVNISLLLVAWRLWDVERRIAASIFTQVLAIENPGLMKFQIISDSNFISTSNNSSYSDVRRFVLGLWDILRGPVFLSLQTLSHPPQ